MFQYFQFFSTTERSLLTALKALPPFPSHVRNCLITGPQHRQAQDAADSFEDVSM